MATSDDGFKSKMIFDKIAEALKADGPSYVNKIKGTYAFKIKGGPDGQEGYWIINAKDGNGSVEFNGTEKPDVTLVMKDGDLVDLMTGKLNSQKAFFQGKLKVQGNMGLAMKLQEFQKTIPKAKL